ncbi:MAG: hypothetical protein KA113_13685 [Syntrophaceae bacterium]|nr:hypothetical protein [Syntrophaceae bacterium]
MGTTQKMNEHAPGLSRQKAVQMIRKYLHRQIPKDFEIRDSVPDGGILYGVPKDASCWTVSVSSNTPQVGAGRVICISKKKRKVIFDGLVGE